MSDTFDHHMIERLAQRQFDGEAERLSFEDFCWGEMETGAVEFCRRAPVGTYVYARKDGLEVCATLCASHVHRYGAEDRLRWNETHS